LEGARAPLKILVVTQLDVRTQTGLPRSLPAGCRTAIFVLGSCFHRRLRVRRTEIVVDGVATEATAQGMPRLDLYRALHPSSDDDPNGLSYRSGFWGIVPVHAPHGGEIEVAVRATLADGTTAEAPVGRIPVSEMASIEPERIASAVGGGARVAIAMATFDPNPELFRDQVESIRAQTIDDWICLVSDDCTPPQAFERMRSVLEGDRRFVLSRSDRRLGFYLNFERALALVRSAAPYVALADQDDRWYPDKLETLLESLGDAQLVYSDQRVVDTGGRVVAEGYWTDQRRNNYTNLASLLIANTVTGAASLFRGELLDVALPFPEPPGDQFHDHWVGLVALSTGRIAYVDRPLYDYVQHEGAALGHVAANAGVRRGVFVRRLLRGQWTGLVSGWRAAYFLAYCRLRLLAEVLLMRGDNAMDRRSKRMLRRFTRIERSPVGFAWLAGRRARRWLGKTETLGVERVLLQGILWRYLVKALAVGRRRPIRRVPYDASFPARKQRGGGLDQPRVDPGA
jgi:glycosyltransferase involved in cell wall biosynthesis